MNGHLIGMHVKGHIGGMEEVFGEVFLDDVALVSATDDEVIDAMLRVNLQNVPENRTAANLDHRLGTNYRFFRETRADAASEDNCFHGLDGLLRCFVAFRGAGARLPTSRLSITCPGCLFSIASPTKAELSHEKFTIRKCSELPCAKSHFRISSWLPMLLVS